MGSRLGSISIPIWTISLALFSVLGALGVLSSPMPARAEAEAPETEAFVPTGRGAEAWLGMGARFDANVSVNPDRVERANSPIFHSEFSGYDQRKLWQRELRSLGYIDFDVDMRNSSRDFLWIRGATGPIFELGESWQLHTAVGAEVSVFGYDFFSTLGAIYVTFGHLDTSWLRSMHVDLGYEHVSPLFEGGDAPWVDLYLQLGWDEIGLEGDYLTITPLLEHYQADEARFRYSQAELGLQYGTLLTDSIEGLVSATGWFRYYQGSEPDVDGNRRDFSVIANASLTWWTPWHDRLALELHGSYGRNWSNDALQDYDAGSVGLTVYWKL